MVPSKVGVREFRAGLAEYIASEQPVAVTRHGQTVGLFIPVKTDLTAELAALRASVTAVQDELAAAGVDAEGVLAEFEQARSSKAG